MASINYDEVSYAELITFLKVARTLSMSAAAKELHISQPAVSKRIASLEQRYGLILFVRAGRSLRLTPAGNVFRQELLASHEHLRNAFVKAEAVQANPARILRLGYDGFFDFSLLGKIVAEYSSQYRELQIQKVKIDHYHEEDCAGLFTGKYDLMICPDAFAVDIQDRVGTLPLGAFQFNILVSREHELANRNDVTLRDLMGVPLVVAHNNEDSPYIKTLRNLFVPYGFSPRIERLSSMESLCFEIVSDAGVGIASPVFWRRYNERIASYFEENIRAYPIPGAFYPVSLVWRADETDQAVEDFVECFREFIAVPENAAIARDSYCLELPYSKTG